MAALLAWQTSICTQSAHTAQYPQNSFEFKLVIKYGYLTGKIEKGCFQFVEKPKFSCLSYLCKAKFIKYNNTDPLS